MYSKSQIEALELLDKYFNETPKSVVKTNIQAVTKLRFVGSTAKDYFSLIQKYLNYQPFKKKLEVIHVHKGVASHTNKYINPQINVILDGLNLSANLFYSNKIKSVVYPTLQYNHLDVSKKLLTYSKKSRSIFNLIQA